jgi:hypothetical protein
VVGRGLTQAGFESVRVLQDDDGRDRAVEAQRPSPAGRVLGLGG